MGTQFKRISWAIKKREMPRELVGSCDSDTNAVSLDGPPPKDKGSFDFKFDELSVKDVSEDEDELTIKEEEQNSNSISLKCKGCKEFFNSEKDLEKHNTSPIGRLIQKQREKSQSPKMERKPFLSNLSPKLEKKFFSKTTSPKMERKILDSDKIEKKL